MCLTFGLFFFVVAMAVLVIDESLLDFGLDKGQLVCKKAFISPAKRVAKPRQLCRTSYSANAIKKTVETVETNKGANEKQTFVQLTVRWAKYNNLIGESKISVHYTTGYETFSEKATEFMEKQGLSSRQVVNVTVTKSCCPAKVSYLLIPFHLPKPLHLNLCTLQIMGGREHPNFLPTPAFIVLFYKYKDIYHLGV